MRLQTKRSEKLQKLILAKMIYERIAENRKKSFLLVAFFVLFLLVIVFILTKVFNLGYFSMAVLSIFVILQSFYNYYHGDKIVLKLSRAVPADRNKFMVLYDVTEALSIGYGLKTPKIYILPDQSINAFSTGRDPEHASIAVTLGAVKKLSRAELEGVIGHELSHIKNYDIRLMTVVSVFVGIIFMLASIFRNSFWSFNSDNNDDSISIIFMILGVLLIILSPLIARIIQSAISRHREFLADADSALLTHNPKGLIGALKKIKNENAISKVANAGNAHMFFANPLAGSKRFHLFDTHPPIDERIKALEDM